MAKRKLRNVQGQRPKAWVGAAISAIGAIGSAIGNAYSANQQAQAQEAAAKTQADAMLKANELSIQHQKEMIDFQKRENEINRQIMRSAAMNEQMQAGEQNLIARQQANRIQLKRGGIKGKQFTSPLRGGNMAFRVVDGGGVLPLGFTPAGNELYEIVGDNHNQSHKTKGGKRKTGVGIKFADGQVVEGEGNGNTNRGELLMITPDGAEFISKHTINGFNPREAVYSGMAPEDAYTMQELAKHTPPVEGMDRVSLKCGGRKKAFGGLNVNRGFNNYNFYDPYGYWGANLNKIGRSTITTPSNTGFGLKSSGFDLNTDFGLDRPVRYSSSDSTTPSNSSWYNGLEDYEKNYVKGTMGQVGANIAGSVISGIGNAISSSMLRRANNRASAVLSDAYNRMSGIDMSLINRNDFKAAHAMAALQAPIVNTGAERAAAQRSLQRAIRTTNRGTLSSAAAQNRLATANAAYGDMIGQIESNADKIRQGIIEGNMNRLTQISNENANRDTQANQNYMDAYLDVLKYNNDINNQKIAGIADVEANRLTGNANTRASLINSSLSGFTNALNNSAAAINQTLGGISTGRQNLRYALLGANQENAFNYLTNGVNYGNPQNVAMAQNMINSISAALKGASTEESAVLRNRLNTLQRIYGLTPTNA